MNFQQRVLTFVILSIELFALWSLFVALVGENSPVAELNSPTIHANQDSDVPGNPIPANYVPRVNKIIVIVIDAMRFDFVPHMKFIKKLLDEENNACIFKVLLDGPTVTLPRIKALVSGATSSYWDILTNLKQSTSISNDNFIWRANSAGKQIVFYGDDTWLKLFPGNEFTRYEGITSFFVTDFYEVDENVTRNVYKELDRMEFDMMILHYLGVDHVGHVHGPRHPLIPVKLDEMNAIVEHIYKSVQVLESDLPNLILVTGDHGMANQGGHGGDSLPEVTTPLISITVDSKQSQRMERTCNSNSAEWKESPFSLKQVDIASTISYLWGLPFPENSRGLVPAEILAESPLNSHLDLLIYNAKHLSKFLSHQKKSHRELLLQLKMLLDNFSNSTILDKDSLLSAISDFQSLLVDIRCAAVQDPNQDTLSMLFSSVLLFQAVVLLILTLNAEIGPSKMSTVFCGALFLASFCTYSVLPSGPASIFIVVTIISVLLVIKVCSVLKFTGLRKLFEFTTNIKLENATILMLVYVGSSILYLSSSFVEEEHFSSYFLYSSALLLSIICTLDKEFKFNSTKLTNFLLILTIHRFCIELNATGQKWNYLSDLSDLLREYKLTELIALLAVVLIFVGMNSKIEKVSVILIGVFKLRINTFIFEWDRSFEHWEGKLCYLFILSSLVIGKLSRNRNAIENTWILLATLLQRTENIILIPLVSYQVKLIRETFSECQKFAVVLINSLFFCAFFYQLYRLVALFHSRKLLSSLVVT